MIYKMQFPYIFHYVEHWLSIKINNYLIFLLLQSACHLLCIESVRQACLNSWSTFKCNKFV